VLLPSRTDLFPATDLSPNQFSFSRSYGVNWPSSFAIVLLKPLCISHTPTCVGFQYGFFFSWDSFQDQLDSTSILFSKSSPYTSSLFSPFSFPHWASSFSVMSCPLPKSTVISMLFLHLDSPFSFPLGTVLPNSKYSFVELSFASCWNPWGFGRIVSHDSFRYSCQHSHFWSLLRNLIDFLLLAIQNVLLPWNPFRLQSPLRLYTKSRVSLAQTPSSCTLLRVFQRMAASKPTAKLSSGFHFLSHFV